MSRDNQWWRTEARKRLEGSLGVKTGCLAQVFSPSVLELLYLGQAAQFVLAQAGEQYSPAKELIRSAIPQEIGED